MRGLGAQRRGDQGGENQAKKGKRRDHKPIDRIFDQFNVDNGHDACAVAAFAGLPSFGLLEVAPLNARQTNPINANEINTISVIVTMFGIDHCKVTIPKLRESVEGDACQKCLRLRRHRGQV